MGNVLASAGMWIQQTTLGWVVYDMTGSSTLLGAINGMRSIPMITLAPFAGIAADRLNRRNLMLVTQVIMLLITFGLGVGLALHKVNVAHLFAFTFLAGIAQVFNMPVRQTVVFDLVPRASIPNAVALNTLAFNVTRVVGPSFAGFLIAWVGPHGNFFVQSAAYLGVAVSILMIAFPPMRKSLGRRSVAKNLGESLRYIAGEPSVRVLVLMGIVPPLFIIPAFSALMPVFAKDIYHQGPAGLGFLLSAIGVGAVVGALITASMGRLERRGLVQLLSLFATGLAVMGFALVPSFAWALVFLAVAGFCEQLYMVTNQTVLQLIIPDHMRGRIIGLLMMSMGLMPVGSLLAGVGADIIGAQRIVAAMAAVIVAFSLVIAVAVPRVRNMRMSQVVAGANSRSRVDADVAP